MEARTIYTQTFRGVSQTYSTKQDYSKAWDVFLPGEYVFSCDTKLGVEFESRETGERMVLTRIENDVCYALLVGKGVSATPGFYEIEMSDITFPARRAA